jgi:hypothetical protein
MKLSAQRSNADIKNPLTPAKADAYGGNLSRPEFILRPAKGPDRGVERRRCAAADHLKYSKAIEPAVSY